jgi:hypothetical protein
MASKHTKEPWRRRDRHVVADKPPGQRGPAETVVASASMAWRGTEECWANAVRIVAAVNACKGLPTEALEDGDLTDVMDAHIRELSAALEQLLVAWDLVPADCPSEAEYRRRIDAAVTRARTALPAEEGGA